jgi:hypothetical protein
VNRVNGQEGPGESFNARITKEFTLEIPGGVVDSHEGSVQG